MRSRFSDIEPKHRPGIAIWRARRGKHLGVFIGLALTTAGLAATTGYKYDALGRLEQVTHDNGNVTTYTMDAAGNRTLVTDLSSQAAPATITVPLTSTGNYTVTWTAGGSVTGYELYESTNSGFSSQTKVYQGAGTSASISGHGAGTYYYRVRACNGSACGNYAPGAHTTLVTLPPGTPSSHHQCCRDWSVPRPNTSSRPAAQATTAGESVNRPPSDSGPPQRLSTRSSCH